MSDRASISRWTPSLIGAGLLIVAAVAVAIWQWPRDDTPDSLPALANSPPIPPYSETRFLNSNADVKYVGVSVCAECHKDNHASYLHTMHSRALAVLDPATEPPDGGFEHTASGRTYRAYREGGKLRHEEILKDADGKVIARVDVPIKYLIGSGSFGRTYLFEADGYLHESPMTWYKSAKKWGMSPGYDLPVHWSFERPIKIGCLNCHAGRAQTAEGATHKMIVHEQAIGCERCHGPGGLHVERQRTKKSLAGEDDFTIVNPAKLTRPLLEAICSDCHLNGPAVVAHRGRGPTDYRPGRPLTDFRTDYRFDSGSEQMTVVGHVEQLRKSRCYQAADGMTCITCHSLHEPEQPKDRAGKLRQICLDCHGGKGCSLELSARMKKVPADNCVVCHMPQGDTEIPHVAFTHHRIGKHRPGGPVAPSRVPELTLVDEPANLSLVDRQRNLGLAYLGAAGNADFARYSGEFRRRALSSLSEAYAGGVRDAATAQGLAELLWQEDRQRARQYANEALAAADLEPESRALALMLLAGIEFDEGNYKVAIGRLEELVRLRRFSEDWRVLGMSYLQDGQFQDAIRSLEHARAIRPFQPMTNRALFDAYRRLGDERRAQECSQRVRWLEQLKQQ